MIRGEVTLPVAPFTPGRLARARAALAQMARDREAGVVEVVERGPAPNRSGCAASTTPVTVVDMEAVDSRA